MIASKIRKAGNSYVVTIPPDEMKVRGLHEGQLVGFEPVPVEIRPVAPLRLTADEEAGTGGDLPHSQIVHDLEERTKREISAGLYSRTDLDQARRDVDESAAWVRSL